MSNEGRMLVSTRPERLYMCLTIQSLFSHKLKRRISGWWIRRTTDDATSSLLIFPSESNHRLVIAERTSPWWCGQTKYASRIHQNERIYVDAVFSALFLVAYERATSLSSPSSILYTTNSSSFCHPLTNLVSPLIFSSSAHPIGIF